MSRFTSKQKKELTRIIVALVMFVVLLIADHTNLIPQEMHDSWYMLPVYLVPYFIAGWDVVRKCFLGIAHGQMFDESFLMTLATVGAFGCKEFHEAVAVMLFYQVGEFFQSYAVGKSRGAIADLMSIAPDFANRENEDGTVETIDPDDIEAGDILIIKPGEKIPADSEVLEFPGEHVRLGKLDHEFACRQPDRLGRDVGRGNRQCAQPPDGFLGHVNRGHQFG